MSILRNFCCPLATLLLLGGSLAHPAASALARDQPPCIAEQEVCVPATGTLSYAGKVVAPAGAAENVFGLSLEVAGDLLAVGAPWDSERGYRAGAVYLFRLTGGGWQQVAKLTPKGATPKAMFGSSLDLDGTRLIVGAPGEKDGKMISAGAVYVFDQVPGGGWTQETRLVSRDILAGDFFGASVAALPGGVAIGAHLEDGKGIDSGAVYVFRRKSPGQWEQRQKLQPDALRAGTLFGNALAADGRHLVIGAYGYDGTSPGGGAVYVYRADPGGIWSLSQTLQPDQRKAFAEFGWTLALAGERLVVGAPYEDESERQVGAAYLFRLDPARNIWMMDSKLRYKDPKWKERFGASVALAGERVIVGAPYGVSYVFAPATDGKGWQQIAKLMGHIPAADNLFSRTVASDGRTIALGVPMQGEAAGQNGAAYLFQVTHAADTAVDPMPPQPGKTP